LIPESVIKLFDPAYESRKKARSRERAALWGSAGIEYEKIKDYPNAFRCYKKEAVKGFRPCMNLIERLYADKKIDLTEEEMSLIRDEFAHAFQAEKERLCHAKEPETPKEWYRRALDYINVNENELAAYSYEKADEWYDAGVINENIEDYPNALRCYKKGTLMVGDRLRMEASMKKIEWLNHSKKIVLTEAELSSIKDQFNHAVEAEKLLPS
jgi:tetratricopeptide (TPR) repeat protein